MIQRRTPIKRTPIRRVSKKRAKESRVYTQKRKAFLEAHPWCQVWLIEHGFDRDFRSNQLESFAPMVKGWAGEILVCPRSRDVHHRAGRTGSNYLDQSTWLAVCRENHERIHNNPSWAREKGYLK